MTYIMTIQWLNINWQLESVKKAEDTFKIDNKEYVRYDLWITIMWGKMLVNKYVTSDKTFNLENNKSYSFPVSAWARTSKTKKDDKWDFVQYVTYKLTGEPVII